jgi:N-formylglutamate amidohydrolase
MRGVWIGLLNVLLGMAFAAESEWGEKKFIEYRPGTLPWVIAVPHGGKLKPDGVPARTIGRLMQDGMTQELAGLISDECQKQIGARPHIILCHLHRQKVDCNREQNEATQGGEIATRAWKEFHAFIERAMSTVDQQQGKGWFIDLHGHRHAEMLVELGYTVAASQLRSLTEQAVAKSSLAALDRQSPSTGMELMRGEASLGAMLEAKGFPAIPSPQHPAPKEGQEYFNGGYNTVRYGQMKPEISGFQIECPFEGVRDTAEHRERFAKGLVECLRDFWKKHLESEVGVAR